MMPWSKILEPPLVADGKPGDRGLGAIDKAACRKFQIYFYCSIWMELFQPRIHHANRCFSR